jgi:uncharacterized protein YjbI with pentapeptide repeats
MLHTSPRREEYGVDPQQSRWRPTRRRLLWALARALAIVAALTVAVLIGYRYGITLWDWLKLLIVPAVLAIGGYLFNSAQNRATQAAAERHAQDDALQAYLDHMSDMLRPNKDQPSLYEERPVESLNSVARARTLTVLSRLDGNRKARVVQFLYEAGLINKNRLVLDLKGADLSYANLSGGAYLGFADLSNANLSGANLSEANLSYANLRWANLGGAYLRAVTMFCADLSYANLSQAQGWTDDQLNAANSLKGATMPDGQKYEDWLKDKEG